MKIQDTESAKRIH